MRKLRLLEIIVDCSDGKRSDGKLSRFVWGEGWRKRKLIDLKVRSVSTLLSPLLANIGLHGLEETLKEFAKTIDLMRNNKGHQKSWQMKAQSLSIIRYADDFVVLHADKTVVQRCRDIISKWLLEVGLELKPEKTRLTHTFKPELQQFSNE